MRDPIDDQIDNLPMHEMSTEEALKAIDPNSLAARLTRRKVRYFLYCLRSQLDGKTMPADFPADLPGKIMLQKGFDGWANFANTWDVSLHDPYLVVSRNH